jgi:predicted enzyme related to lactoylglutathione lyase
MNGICHIEIPSKDFEKAKKFYGDVFGWEFQMMGEMDYMTFKPPDGPGGGFDKSLEIASKPNLHIYIEVDNIDAALKKVEGAGGTTVKEKTQITPEYGYFAIFSDLEGNKISIWGQN